MATYSSSYDEVPYDSRAFSQSHPDRLATLGRLFGLAPAPVARCRVLELGCASGGNLIPMAFNLPFSEFVGVDLSKRQVETGLQEIYDLDLKNIRIEQASILDVNASWGAFDYIICHGVYSWVTDEVQDKILAISSGNLAPQGIAYVSYNTYPGWHMREMLRHMMLYHANLFEDTSRRIEQARALMDFLARSVPSVDSPYSLLLKREIEFVRSYTDSYILHEYLDKVNSPVYFRQFTERSDAHGLQYLADADFGTMLISAFPGETAATLREISQGIISSEQYMDFVRNRFFRQTLLCHKDLPLKRDLGPQDLEGMLIASAADGGAQPPNLLPGEKQIFHTHMGQTIETDYPLTKAALTVLNVLWPRAIDLDALFSKAGELLGESLAPEDVARLEARQTLAEDMLRCYAAGAVEFHTWQADFVSEISNKPKVSSLAAYQVAQGHCVVNQRHEMVNLEQLSGQLVALLDGTKDRSSLLRCLTELAGNGTLSLIENGKAFANPDLLENALATAAEQSLASLARAALLVE